MLQFMTLFLTGFAFDMTRCEASSQMKIIQSEPIISNFNPAHPRTLTEELIQSQSPGCYPFLSESGDDGIIKSKSADQSNYSPDLHCIKIITAPVGYRVVVEFVNSYDIEIKMGMNSRHFHNEGEKCPFDYLIFQDGPFAFSRNLTEKICGTGIKHPNILSSSGYMRIVFHTDSKTQKMGFTLRYSFEKLQGGHDFRTCYFYVPIHKQTEFHVQNTDFVGSVQCNSSNLDCVWDIHNNDTDEKLWILISNISRMKHVESPSDRRISIYMTSGEIWDDRVTDMYKSWPYLSDMKTANLPTSRVLIQVYGSKLSYIPNFTVNVSTYVPPEDPISGHCGQGLFDCRNKQCLNMGMVCNGYVNCQNGEDESDSICSGSTTTSKGQKKRRHIEKNGVILVGVAVSFFLLMILSIVVYTYRNLRRRAETAAHERLVATTRNPTYDHVGK